MRVSRRGKNLKLIVDDDVAEGITPPNHRSISEMHDNTWRQKISPLIRPLKSNQMIESLKKTTNVSIQWFVSVVSVSVFL